MSNFRTSRDLADRAAGMLNFLRPGEDMSERDLATFNATWAEVNAELVFDGISTWPDDQIPLEVFRLCARLLALEVAPEFGALPPLLQSLNAQTAFAGKEQVKGMLRRLLAEPPTYEPLKVNTI